MAKANGRRGVTKAAARRAEQEKEAKAGETEVRTAGGAGDLPLPRADKLMHHVNEIKGWNAKITTLTAKRRLAYKAAKAEHVSAETINDLIKMERGDPAEFRHYIESISLALKQMGAPFQLSVFDTIYSSPVDQAVAEARIAAKAGRAPECRFPEGTPAFDAYMDEFTKLQAARAPVADKLSEAEIDGAVAAGRKDAVRQPELAH